MCLLDNAPLDVHGEDSENSVVVYRAEVIIAECGGGGGISWQRLQLPPEGNSRQMEEIDPGITETENGNNISNLIG